MDTQHADDCPAWDDTIVMEHAGRWERRDANSDDPTTTCRHPEIKPSPAEARVETRDRDEVDAAP